MLYGEGSEQFKRSFKRWRSLLRKGCVAAVIKELQELHASGRYNKQQCYDLQGEINYFTANQASFLCDIIRTRHGACSKTTKGGDAT